ncbi:MAG: histidine phosphatase family protein [Peptococcaceae bacterium]|nr:histidine phosphatase family protein [Peptococcaceae bacterium]MDH7524125.1 histidine phosphatase family protein [Peptococcaceae bacterium]
MTARIILIRHGLTLWNYELRYQGHTDTRLNSEGVRQARALRERIRNEKLVAVFSSDLRRAVETAQIIASSHRLEVKTSPLLREINFGVWEGLTYQDIERDYPEQLRIWKEAPHLLKVERAETFVELKERALKGLQEILAVYPSGNIAVVTHGGTIAAMLCGLLNEPLSNMWKYRQKNAAVNIVVIRGKEVTVELLNDTSHLEETG